MVIQQHPQDKTPWLSKVSEADIREIDRGFPIFALPDKPDYPLPFDNDDPYIWNKEFIRTEIEMRALTIAQYLIPQMTVDEIAEVLYTIQGADMSSAYILLAMQGAQYTRLYPARVRDAVTKRAMMKTLLYEAVQRGIVNPDNNTFQEDIANSLHKTHMPLANRKGFARTQVLYDFQFLEFTIDQVPTQVYELYYLSPYRLLLNLKTLTREFPGYEATVRTNWNKYCQPAPVFGICHYCRRIMSILQPVPNTPIQCPKPTYMRLSYLNGGGEYPIFHKMEELPPTTPQPVIEGSLSYMPAPNVPIWEQDTQELPVLRGHKRRPHNLVRPINRRGA